MAADSAQPWRLISWNVNGVRAVAKKDFFATVKAMNPDILCLQETKAQDDQVYDTLTEMRHLGYHLVSSSAERKGYSGTAILSRTQPVLTEVSLGGRPDFNTEGRHIRADYKTDWGEFTLFNVYFPNGGSGPERLKYKLEYYEHFQAVMRKLLQEGRNLVICGDVNTAHHEIDLARPKENRKTSGFMPEECAWVDRFVGDGFIDTFRLLYPDRKDAYSWWDMKSGSRARNVGWRIDYFFVDQKLKNRVKGAEILADVQGSDHCPVVLSLG